MFHIDVTNHAETLAFVQQSIDELEQQQARAVDKAMDHGMRTEEYEEFDARRTRIRKLKRIVTNFRNTH